MFDHLKEISNLTQSVFVGFSCGKDSIVTLDLCVKIFKKVIPFFMYLVPGLSFQEKYLNYIEEKYNIKILRLPHWQLGDLISSGSYRPQTNISLNCPKTNLLDIETYLRTIYGISWFAYGMRISDSVVRRAILKRCNGVDIKSKRFYPVMNFSKKQIFQYLKQKNIVLPKDYELFGRSFGRLWEQEIIAIKEKYIKDYEKIKECFPYVEAVVKRYEFRKQI